MRKLLQQKFKILFFAGLIIFSLNAVGQENRSFDGTSNNLQNPEWGNDAFKGTCTSGIAYAVNPHTRLKINAFSNYELHKKQNEFGFFLQLVTGFGLRG